MDSRTKALLRWYETNKRTLPWRTETPNPYHVWLSEIMLQQTRAAAVIGYYDRFLRALPDIRSLAAAPEDVYLKLWEGLGYYSRVRNLHKAAQVICAEYGGELPHTAPELVKLPGIGAYTAGAIASIAFGEKEPAVDGNVLRVWTRATANGGDILLPATKKQVEAELREILPGDGKAGLMNQAMMDLGELVCPPNGAPRCEVCPWKDSCKAHAAGEELSYPVKSLKKARTIEDMTVLMIQDREKTLIRKRPAKGLLAGLYEYPHLPGHLTPEEVQEHLESIGIPPIRITRLADGKHIFTHKEWHMIGYAVRADELRQPQPSMETGEAAPEPQALLAVSTRELVEKIPVPSAFKIYSAWLKAQDLG